MSQVGPKERSAKDKTESKQLKSVRNFIARTQAKVHNKLTQNRLFSLFPPAKRENDPFHPSLDLSRSHHPMSFQTMNNPKMSQKNSSTRRDNRSHRQRKERPRTTTSSPSARTANQLREGSHPRDAEELKQQEKCREDPCGDSAMNNNAALGDNARRTNEVEPDNSLLTPREEQSTPSAIPSPEGTHEKAEDGEDPTRMIIPESPSSTLPLPRMVSLQNSWLNIKVR